MSNSDGSKKHKPSSRPRPTGSTDPGFQVGDRVTWSSQAAGSTLTKLGTIVEVVPPNKHPTKINSYAARSNVSYIVEARVVGASSKTKAKLYWPLVSDLKRVRKAVVTFASIVPKGQAPAGCEIREEETGSNLLPEVESFEPAAAQLEAAESAN